MNEDHRTSEQIVNQMSAYNHIGPGEIHGFERSQHFIGKSYKDFLSHWDIPQNATILDIATGRGEAADFLRELFDAQVIQTDLSTFPLHLQQTWFRRLMRQTKPLSGAKTSEQPFSDNIFDAIHMKDALVHIENKDEFFAEMSRLLKPGGKLLLITQMNKSSNVFFLTPQTSHNKEVPLTGIEIAGSSEYAALVRQIQTNNMTYKNKKYSSISPPYFKVNFRSMLRIASNNSLVPVTDSYVQKHLWLPGEDEPDWHHAPRRALEFIKK